MIIDISWLNQFNLCKHRCCLLIGHVEKLYPNIPTTPLRSCQGLAMAQLQEKVVKGGWDRAAVTSSQADPKHMPAHTDTDARLHRMAQLWWCAHQKCSGKKKLTCIRRQTCFPADVQLSVSRRQWSSASVCVCVSTASSHTNTLFRFLMCAGMNVSVPLSALWSY